jgi:putative transposase
MMARTRPWELSDAFWARAEPLIPARTGKKKAGRPAKDDREMLGALLYVLRTGIQWNALPRAVGASSTVYDRFRRWLRAGLFLALWRAGLEEYDELEGLEWEWQSVDGAMTKAPFGGGATGPNPTDRAKRGTKRSVLSEGHGLPLAVVVAGANRPDTTLLAATLDATVVERPEPTEEAPQGACLDAGYDNEPARQVLAARGYTPHIRPRGEDRENARSADPAKRPRRWVVERLHSWLDRSRRLLVRWEKRTDTYEAFIQLACALLCFQHCDRLIAARTQAA